jgi:hypothetical protein
MPFDRPPVGKNDRVGFIVEKIGKLTFGSPPADRLSTGRFEEKEFGQYRLTV